MPFRAQVAFLWKQKSRVPGENRDPVFDVVLDFRRDDAWTPAFAGVTENRSSFASC